MSAPLEKMTANDSRRLMPVGISWKSGKKQFSLPSNWSDMTKTWDEVDSKNAVGLRTGQGLYVIDLDTKEVPTQPEYVKLLKTLGAPTVETSRGYHWYIESDVPMKTTQNIYNDKTFAVDIRGEGGFVACKYTGEAPTISYKRVSEPQHDNNNIIYNLLPPVVRKTDVAAIADDDDDLLRIADTKYPAEEVTKMLMATSDKYLGREWLLSIVASANALLDPSEVAEHREIKGKELLTHIIGDWTRAKWSAKRDINEIKKVLLEVLRGKFGRKHHGGTLIKEALAGGWTFPLDTEELDKLIENTDASDAAGLQKLVAAVVKLKSPVEQDIYRKKLKDARLLTFGVFDRAAADLRAKTEEAQSVKYTCDIGWDGQKGVFCEMDDTQTEYFTKQNYITTLASRHKIKEKRIRDELRFIKEVNIVYRPGGLVKTEKEMNIWRGVDYVDDGRGWSYIDKVLDNLFHLQPDDKQHFIRWLAYIVQNHRKTGIAWGFFGAQGTGKGLIVQVIEQLLGARNCALNVGDNDLNSAQNMHYLWEREFVQLNEVASNFHARQNVAGQLKTMITDDMVQINGKYIKQFTAENFVNVILNSNKSNPIELDIDDRRWNMVLSRQPLKELKWWTATRHLDVLAQAQSFGVYLQGLDVTAAEACRLAPASEAKKMASEQTIPHHIQLANFINKKDAEGLLEYLQFEESLTVSQEAVIDAANSGWWGNSLLIELYKLATEEVHVSAKKMVSRLKPHLIDGEYKQRNNEAGFRERGWMQK